MEEFIMLEVLVRLPVKSILRCKCLSKKWYRFISGDPLFRQTYLSRKATTAPRLLGFFSDKIRPKQAYSTMVDFFPTPAEGTHLIAEEETLNALPLEYSLQFTGHESFNIVASSNGFLLCSLEEFNPLTYFLCNPMTKQYVGLPAPNFTGKFVAHGLICQPSTGNFQFNLKRCVVVRVTRPDGARIRCPNVYIIELFDSSVSCDQWKILNLTTTSLFQLSICPCPPAIVRAEEGGDFVFYWMGISQEGIMGVAIFDPREDYLEFIELPRGELDTSDCFSTSDGLLLFARQNLRVLEIWILRDNGNNTREWTLKHTLDFQLPLQKYSEIVGRPLDAILPIQIIAFHPTKPGVLFLYSKGKMLMYDYETDSFELVCDLRAQHVRYFNFSYFFLYVWPQWPPFLP